jgi:hypothetical protein
MIPALGRVIHLTFSGLAGVFWDQQLDRRSSFGGPQPLSVVVLEKTLVRSARFHAWHELALCTTKDWCTTQLATFTKGELDGWASDFPLA